MTTETFPREVFCVLRNEDGQLYVARRTLLGRSGSWYRFRTQSGIELKENGNRWSDTAAEALNREASHILHRFRFPAVWSDDCMKDMASLLKECFEWGRMSGATESALVLIREQEGEGASE